MENLRRCQACHCVNNGIFYPRMLCSNCKPGSSQSHITSILTPSKQELKDASTELADDLAKIFWNQTLSDVKMRSDDGEDIPAHKVILCARSPVFLALLSSDMQEAKIGIVQSPFESEILKSFLEFVYTDSCEALSGADVDLLTKLLETADYYQVESLKTACERLLIKKLKMENCLDLLITADQFRACGLKKKALDFIRATGDKKQIANRDFKRVSKDLVVLMFKYAYGGLTIKEIGDCGNEMSK